MQVNSTELPVGKLDISEMVVNSKEAIWQLQNQR
jgi:hypothetical protein